MTRIRYAEQTISETDIEEVVKVLKSDFLTQGPTIPAFEEEVSKVCHAKYAVAVNSATSALHLSCLALDVGPGDIVWTTPNTFVSTSNAAKYCGATVDFVDIDRKTFNVCLSVLTRKLEDARRIKSLPKVLIVVHFAGQSADMKAIHDLSQIFGFKILEDASHAIGGKYKGLPVGICKYSDAAVFSFHPVKIITSGEGGMIVTQSKAIADRVYRLRSHGITSDKDEMKKCANDELWNYQQLDLGFNYRMTDIHAALGLSQLKQLNKFVEKRHKIANWYNRNLNDLPVILPYQSEESYSSFHLYTIRLQLKEITRSKIEIFNRFREKDILVNFHYIPVYRQPYYEAQGFKKGYCPEAEKYFQDAISIPMHPGLTDDDLQRVLEVSRDSIR